MIATAAWVFAGIALWFSRGVVDVFDAGGRVTRVAMLPSVPELLGLIVLMLLAAAGVAACVRRWTSSADDRAEAFLQISLPLFSLVLTLVPYLPWVPDQIQPLRALAGPIVKIIWFAVAGQVIITFFSVRSTFRLARSNYGTGVVNAVLAVAIGTALMSIAWLRVRDTLAGLALIDPAGSGLGHLQSGVWLSIAMAAATALLTWRWVFVFTGSNAASAFAWVSIFLGVPFFFTAISRDPAIPAALCVMTALAWNTRPQQRDASWVEYLIRGLAVSALPWLSLTYVPMAVVIAGVLGIRALKNPKAVLGVMVPFTLSLLRRLTLPHEPAQFGNPIAGVAGLLFDQEFGVVPYVPAIALGFVGLWQMVWARDAMVRQRGRELTAVFGVLLITAGVFVNWWQAFAPPGRALAPGLPLLALPIAWAYLGAPQHSVRRSLYHLLALLGAAMTLALMFSEQGSLIVQDRDGSSRLLQWLTALWPIWSGAPTVAAYGLRSSAGIIALWLVAAGTVAWVSRRNSSRQAGVSALTAMVNLSAAILVVALLAPAIGRAEPESVTEPEARSRLPLLDDFDSQARPHAIIYRPFVVAHAADIPPLMTLAATPGLRSGGQPVRVLLNARYALAAGDYKVEIGDLRNTEIVRGTVGLQVGRIGGPMREWDVQLAPGATWRGEFSLPVDAEFVGLVTSENLAAAESLRITPLRIVDKNNRESTFHGPSRIVLSAVQGRSAAILFHDEDVYPEKTGFWVHGESTALMTVAAQRPEDGVTLRVHSGAVPNTVTFATSTWGEHVALVPGTPRDIRVPAPARPGPFLLKITTDKSFVPANLTPGNTDRRILGCWVEVVQE